MNVLKNLQKKHYFRKINCDHCLFKTIVKNKIYYSENTEGGHAGASTNEQRAKMYAQIYSYLQMKLMDK